MKNEYSYELRGGTCDGCRKRCLGAEVLCGGTPVLLLCADCDDHKLVELAFFRQLMLSIFGRAAFGFDPSDYGWN